MSALTGLLRDWAPLIGLVALGLILRVVISSAYRLAKRRLDRAHPDDLPLHAGQWLEEEVERRGIDVRVLVSSTNEEGVDAFLPSAGSVLLSHQTYYKKDPSFWAVAAHELGHVLTYRRASWVPVVLEGARIVGISAASVANAMILANIMFASAAINRLAFALASAGLVMFVVVLLDELAASIVAVGILRRDARVDARGMRGARAALAAAFMTYLGGFAGHGLLVWERDFAVAKIEHDRHFVPAAHLGTAWLVLSAALSLPVMLLAWREIRLALRPRQADTMEEAKRLEGWRALREIVRGALTLGLVAIVWAQPFGLAFAIACVLAVLASRKTLALLTSPVLWLLKWPLALVLLLGLVPPLVVLVAVHRARAWLFGARKSEPRPEAKTEPGGAVALVKPDGAVALLSADALRSAGVLEAHQLELRNRPPWTERLSRIAYAACHVALVVAFWSGVASG